MAKSILTRDSAFATSILNWAVAWCLSSAIFGIPLMIVGSIVVWLVYGCWPMGRYGDGGCTESIMAVGDTWVIFTPMIVGGLAGLGFVFAKRMWLRTLFKKLKVS